MFSFLESSKVYNILSIRVNSNVICISVGLWQDEHVIHFPQEKELIRSSTGFHWFLQVSQNMFEGENVAKCNNSTARNNSEGLKLEILCDLYSTANTAVKISSKNKQKC